MPLTPINRNPTRRTQLQNRRVANPARFMRPEIAGAGFGALAATFDSFAKKKSAEEEQLEVLEDEKALANLALSVSSREAEAIEAVRSGDYTGFMDTNRAGRINVLKNAPLVIGGAIGTARATSFAAEIDKLGPTENAAARARDYIEQSTQGMDPRAALKFAEAFQKGIAPALKNRQEQLEKLVAERMQSQFLGTLEGNLRTGAIRNLDDLNKMVWTTANAFGNNVENQLKLQDMADEMVARMAAAGDPMVSARAMALLDERDPNRGNSTIAERLGPAKVDSLMNEQSKAWYRYVGKEASEAMRQAKMMVARYKATGEGPNIGQVSQWLFSKLDDLGAHGPGPDGVRTEMYNELAKEANRDALPLTDAKNGWTMAEVKAAWEKARGNLQDPLLTYGVAFNGAHTELKTKLSNDLKTGSGEDFAKARAFVNSAQIIGGGRPLTDYFNDDAAMAIFLATENDDPQKALINRGIILERVVEEGGFKGAFSKLTDLSIVGDNDSNRAVLGTKGYDQMGQRIFKDTTALKAVGLEDVTWDNMDDTLKGEHFRRLLDIATLAAGGDVSEENIKKNFLRMFSNDIERGSLGSDGEPKWSVRKTPKLVVASDGTPVRSKAIEKQMAQRFVEELDEADLTGRVGYRTDLVTEKDGTVQIRVDIGYGMQPVDIPANKRVIVPEEFMGKEVLGGHFIVSDHGFTTVPGMVVLEAPDPDNPPEGMTIPDVLYVSPVSELRFNRKSRVWQLRRALGADAKALEGRVASDHEALKAELEASGTTVEDLDGALRTLDDLTNKALQAREARAAARDQYVGLSEPELDAAIDAAESEGNVSDLRGLMLEKRRRENGEPTETEKVKAEPHLSTEAIKQMVDEGDPRTLSMEQLEAALIERHKAGRKGTNQDIIAAMKERKAGVPPTTLATLLPDRRVPGSGLAVDELSMPKRAEHDSVVKSQISKTIMDGVMNGTYTYEALAMTRNASSVPEAIKIAEDITKRTGHMDTTLEAAKITPFMSKVVDFVVASEGFRELPYWDPGAKPPQLNIGYGFSLTRPDAEEALEAAGTSKEEVMNGKPIDDKQAAILASFAIAKQEQFLRKWLPGVKLNKHQKLALHSFIYSSRWENGKPTVVGPNIKRAIMSGNSGLVAAMIRETTKVSDPNAKIGKGMTARRNKEAAMYLGRYIKK